MFGLPVKTQITRNVDKTRFFNRFRMSLSNSQKRMIDETVSKMVIVHQLSAKVLNLMPANDWDSIFVLKTIVKSQQPNFSALRQIQTCIDQHLIFLLEFEDQQRLAVIFAGHVFSTQWQPTDTIQLQLVGPNMQNLWEGLIAQIGQIVVCSGRTLEQQIEIDETCRKLDRQIEALEKAIWSEKQDKKKYRLYEKQKRLKEERAKY